MGKTTFVCAAAIAAINLLLVFLSSAVQPTRASTQSLTIYQGTNVIGIPGLSTADFSSCGLKYYGSSSMRGCSYNKNGYFVFYNRSGLGNGDCGNNFTTTEAMVDGYGYYVSAASQCTVFFTPRLSMDVTLYPKSNLVSVSAATTQDQIAAVCGSKDAIFQSFDSSSRPGCKYDDKGYFVYYDPNDGAGDCGSHFHTNDTMIPNLGYFISFNGKNGDHSTPCVLRYVNGALQLPARSTTSTTTSTMTTTVRPPTSSTTTTTSQPTTSSTTTIPASCEFFDDFSGTSLNETKWRYATWFNLNKSLISIEDGNLVMMMPKYSNFSNTILTHDFFGYGSLKFRFKILNQIGGYWGDTVYGIFMYSPNREEVDMEVLGSPVDNAYLTVHHNDWAQNPQTETYVNFSDWNTFRIDILADGTNYYLNGQSVFKTVGTSMDNLNPANTSNRYNLMVQVMENYANYTQDSAMYVDYLSFGC